MSGRPPVAGVLLAAGASRRFGGPRGSKMLAELDGRPVVRHAAEAMLAGGARPLYVVVGHRAQEVAGALPADARVVRHPGYAAGQGTSLARAIEALQAEEARPPEASVVAVAVALGDEPGLRPEAVARLIAAWREARPPAARARYRDRPGHPVVLARRLFPRLRSLRGDEGAARLLERLGDGVLEVELDTAAPEDVDTAADLRRLAGGRPG